MSTTPPAYTAASITDLDRHTEYDAWLLEAVYEITDDAVAVKDVDELIYPPDGKPPTQTIYGAATSASETGIR